MIFHYLSIYSSWFSLQVNGHDRNKVSAIPFHTHIPLSLRCSQSLLTFSCTNCSTLSFPPCCRWCVVSVNTRTYSLILLSYTIQLIHPDPSLYTFKPLPQSNSLHPFKYSLYTLQGKGDGWLAGCNYWGVMLLTVKEEGRVPHSFTGDACPQSCI